MRIRFEDSHGVTRLAAGSGRQAQVDYYEGPDGSVVWAKKLVRADMLTAAQRKAMFASDGASYSRGRITSFSSQSRNRFCERMGSLASGLSRRSLDERDYFVTLTYGKSFPDPERAKRDLAVFRKRLRRAYPDAFGVWIVELQKRGAPHFHLHLRLPKAPFGDIRKRDAKRWNEIFSRWWIEISGLNDSHLAYRQKHGVHTCVAEHGGGTLINYMSKTLSKNNLQIEFSKSIQKEGFGIGRWWGVINPARAKREQSEKFSTWMESHVCNSRLAEIDISLAGERRFTREAPELGPFASVRTSWLGDAAQHLTFGDGSDQVVPPGRWCICLSPLVSTTYQAKLCHTEPRNAHKLHCVNIFGSVP